jgi:hypothetical protein
MPGPQIFEHPADGTTADLGEALRRAYGISEKLDPAICHLILELSEGAKAPVGEPVGDRVPISSFGRLLRPSDW